MSPESMRQTARLFEEEALKRGATWHDTEVIFRMAGCPRYRLKKLVTSTDRELALIEALLGLWFAAYRHVHRGDPQGLSRQPIAS